MKFYFVRHGLTDWNVGRKMQGHMDIPLNDTGREQAAQTAKLLEGKQFDICFASPLNRARETAKIVLGDRRTAVVYDERIMERSFGIHEGDSIDEVMPVFEKWWMREYDGQFDDLEPMADFIARIFDFLDDIKSRYPDKTVLIVAHGGVSAAVRYYLEKREPDGEYRNMIIENCSILEGEI